MNAAIEVSSISKSFRRYQPERPMMLQEVLARGIRGIRGFRASERFWALRDVSFSVPRGRAVGIIGTNGSGKSTLLRLVGGIGSPDTGRVQVAGRVGALLDLGSGLHGDLTGRENVIVAGVLNGLSRREVLVRFDDIVAFSEIEKFIDNPMRTYSSGMQMRLAFAINVHTNPDVLLIDEVLAVGDAAFQRKCLARIKQFKANGCSILLVSHGLATVRQLCDEVIWMHYGQLMAHGPFREVVQKYQAHVGHAMELDDEPGGTTALEPPESAVLFGRPVADGSAPVDEASARVTAVGLIDCHGHSLTEFRAGQSLEVAIDYVAGRATALQFRVRVVREDGVVCCDVSSDPFAPTGLGPQAQGRISLHLERLDLNSGHYGIDVVAHARTDNGLGSALPVVGRPLLVVGDGIREAVMAVPHRWALEHGVAIPASSAPPRR